MISSGWPDGWRLERLTKDHRRKTFVSGQVQVDDWLCTKALQSQNKRLTITSVLLDDRQSVAGFYTLATGQVEFSDLPHDLARNLPRRRLPVAMLAWLGIDKNHQGFGIGRQLLARALRDCYEAGQTFSFIAVVVDCVDDAAKSFYRQFDFQEMPGHPYRLFLSSAQLDAMMAGK